MSRWPSLDGRTARPLVALVLVAALAGACGGDDGDDPAGSTAVVPDRTTTTAAEAEDPGDDEAEATTTSSMLPPPVDSLDGAAIALTEIAQVRAPTALAPRAGTDALYVAERTGAVRAITFTPLSGGGSRAEVAPPIVEVATTTDGERGLLGLAFSPDGARLYVSYTDTGGDTQVDEWTMDGDAVVDGSQRPIFSTDQPFANHNGGGIGFGPDGMLYLGLGDGGGGGDPLGTAQDPNAVLGSVLRIDPTAPADGRAYGIPADNPFAAGGGAPEVWSIGVRNPWRFSWDRESGDLWIADVGQNAIEEVDLLPAGDGTGGAGAGAAEPAGRGANLGWPIFEGNSPFAGGDAPAGYVPPIFDYRQGPGCSITGGFVSRGDGLPTLRGAYLYSDYCDPTVRALLVHDGVLVDERSLDVTVPGGSVASFGEGSDGSLYVMSLSGGIYRIDPA